MHDWRPVSERKQTHAVNLGPEGITLHRAAILRHWTTPIGELEIKEGEFRMAAPEALRPYL